MFTENLCLKKIRSFKPSNPTHPLWFYYHEMYDNFSALNVTFWSLKVMPSHVETKLFYQNISAPEQWVRPFFGLRNWGHFAWPIRTCFFLQIELAFKSRIFVEALTSECNIKLVPTLRTLKKSCLKKREQQIESVIPSDDLSKKEGLCNWNLETSRLSFSSRWLWPNFRMCFIQAVHLSFKKFNSLFGKIPTIPPHRHCVQFYPMF